MKTKRSQKCQILLCRNLENLPEGKWNGKLNRDTISMEANILNDILHCFKYAAFENPFTMRIKGGIHMEKNRDNFLRIKGNAVVTYGI
ncbi:hypothetical protein GCM10008025_28460 [Ornithinibacillus halotolerans]|uniref:Uncharacterized protein n=1 Tax=Ornithinibacillus halotolerans TaxID=1274357 RepID=A0A916WBB3_9BACI|nr:hypothetical protein GCM10008025_28460 [Ornithinibacillus halotolerans]